MARCAPAPFILPALLPHPCTQNQQQKPTQVADLIKADRLNRLNAVVGEVATERAQRFVGRTLEVLVEGVNPRNPGQAFGRLRHNKLVYFDGDGAALRGALVAVAIDRANAYSLFGEMVEVLPPRDPLPHHHAAVAVASSS